VNLSKHFLLREFLVSQTATRMGREVGAPPQEVIDNLQRLAITILEPLRVALGRPVVITSGYRPLWLNTAVGGSPRSAHIDGRASDLNVPGVPDVEVARRIVALNLPFDQVILEFPPEGWVHVGIAREGTPNRRQQLTALKVNGKTAYYKGLVEAA
jgi:zinc D-Ala-D-Ala carboxypeptidase